MAGAGSAILDYEVKVYVEDWRGVGPNDHGVTVPALHSCVYVRNKLQLCSNHLYFGFWIQNLITDTGMLQITSKM